MLRIIKFVIIFPLLIPSAAAGYRLPDTGQTKCYTLTFPYTETACTGTGQDGEYSINPMSHTYNDDGTVTDNNTGLMWQRMDNNQIYNWFKASGTYHATENPSYQDVCGSSTLGGHSDWRLPTKKELVSIVDFSVPYPGPTINETYFPNTDNEDYWTSTPLADDPESIWSVYFSNGSAHYSGKNNQYYVRCVRGTDLSLHSFHANGDGTVTDLTTGLIWQQDEPLKRPWAEALLYCNGLILGANNDNDWRLPSIRELESLADDSRSNPAISTLFPNAHADSYWSSTTNALSPNSVAWYVSFYNGYVSNGYGKSGTLYVRCVRGGGAGWSLHNLTIDISGTGTGEVNGSGVRYGSPAVFYTNINTVEQFDEGTTVKLHAEPYEYSLFIGWTGACSSASDCNLIMNTDKSVTASFYFNVSHKTRIGDTTSYFSTIQGAYNAAPNGETVKAWGTLFLENPTCGVAKEIKLEGGYNDIYTSNTGYTTLQGILTIGIGSLTVENLIIK
jgi:hypothetical protein